MQTLAHSDQGKTSAFQRSRGSLLSAAVHAGLVLAIFAAVQRAPKLVAYKWPGTAKGVRMLTYYSPGSPKHATAELATRKAPTDPATSTAHAVHAPSQPQRSAAPSADQGTGNAALSGLGDGDMRMAYQKYFPYPKPDLSSLPHGKSGDVVLNAVIDEHGNIKTLTLLSGLGSPIDDTVLATVKQWSFTPATRNGEPVASEQEFHFHYEKA